MHMRKCMVQRGDSHGWASRLPWFGTAASMVQPSEMHGSAFAPPSIAIEFLSQRHPMARKPPLWYNLPMSDNNIPGVDSAIPAQNAVSVYSQDAMDDFPVLKAFQQYIDAE